MTSSLIESFDWVVRNERRGLNDIPVNTGANFKITNLLMFFFRLHHYLFIHFNDLLGNCYPKAL